MILILKELGEDSHLRAIADAFHEFYSKQPLGGEEIALILLHDGEEINTLPPARAREIRDLLLKEYPLEEKP